jgi:hypothetical protein
VDKIQYKIFAKKKHYMLLRSRKKWLPLDKMVLRKGGARNGGVGGAQMRWRKRRICNIHLYFTCSHSDKENLLNQTSS